MAESKEEVIVLGKNILQQDDLLIQFNYEGELFVLKYPNPVMRSNIEVEIARRLGGFPRSTFSNDHVIMTEALTTIDYTYIPERCPKWFVPWQCMDERLIMQLYNAYLSFRDEFREKLRSGKYQRGN